jgi:antitoxin MazE
MRVKVDVVRAAKNPRDGWDEAFRRMAENRDDVLVEADAGALAEWDVNEWAW